MRALHAAQDTTLPLEELSNFLATRTAGDESVPTIGPLPARRLATHDLDLLAAIERAAKDVLELFGTEFA